MSSVKVIRVTRENYKALANIVRESSIPKTKWGRMFTRGDVNFEGHLVRIYGAKSNEPRIGIPVSIMHHETQELSLVQFYLYIKENEPKQKV